MNVDNLISINMARKPGAIFGMFILIVLSACEKPAITNVASTDVFIKSMISGSDTLFAIAHAVYSYNRMSLVSVKSPDGDSIALPGNVDGGISIYKDPSLALGDYRKILPLVGTYTYYITYRDNSQQVLTNALGADYLLPNVIDSLTRSQDGSSVLLKWNKVDAAQFYQIRVTMGETEVIAAFLVPQAEKLGVELPYSSFSRFAPGPFTVELDALLYESTNYSQLQAMSNSYVSINLP